MTKLSVPRLVLCSLTIAMAVHAQCPPPGGYGGGSAQPPAGNGGPAASPGSPSAPQPASPSAPGPAGPKAPAPGSPTNGPTTPPGPLPGLRTGPQTGGLALTFDRGHTSKDRLKVEWVHPVPPERSATETSAAGPLALDEALDRLWDAADQRPLLVLRECSLCKDGDEALLHRSLSNDRTLLLTKWFRTVRLPAHVAEVGHPFHKVFAGYSFEGSWPHFFLLAHPGATPVTFTGQQTQTQLWKGMSEVLGTRYAKDPMKAVKEWLSVLDGFDTVDARRREQQDQLDEVRANDGPNSSRAKKLAESLRRNTEERNELIARESRVRDLGLLPMPPRAQKVAAGN